MAAFKGLLGGTSDTWAVGSEQAIKDNLIRWHRYQGVRYFNGGLFATVEPIELSTFELELIGGERADQKGASFQNWSKVNPTIFGSLFQKSMDPKEQHKSGAHYTSEVDIRRIVEPTIIRPWLARIEAAESPSNFFRCMRN